MNLSKEQVIEILKQVQDPELKRDIVALGMVKEIRVEGDRVWIGLEMTTESVAIRDGVTKEVRKKLSDNGAKEATVQISTAQRKNAGGAAKNGIPGIRHIVAVASGKGGVGKSTVTVNLALALASSGNKVGIMDADIYGPNIPLMLGVNHATRPSVNDEDKMIPIEAFGIKMISMGVLVPPDQPMVWRGPMLHSAVTQFFQKVSWGELDYLLVDLPPGTGDVQLSLVQTVPLAGAVIVTTPQEVALMDVRKGIVMFQKTNVPILGVVENMTGEVFGQGGGEKSAAQYQVPFLGFVPLDSHIREGGDLGRPIVVSAPESAAAKAFLKAGMILEESLTKQAV